MQLLGAQVLLIFVFLHLYDAGFSLPHELMIARWLLHLQALHLWFRQEEEKGMLCVRETKVSQKLLVNSHLCLFAQPFVICLPTRIQCFHLGEILVHMSEVC